MTRAMRRTSAVLLVALAAAGCGVRADVGGQAVRTVASPAFLADSAERTADEGTGRVALTVAFTGTPEVGDVEMTGEGAYDTEAGRASMSLDMSQLAGIAGAEGAEIFSEPIEVVVDGTTVYMRMPFLAQAAGGAGDWVKTELGAQGIGGQVGISPETADPRAFLEFLRGAGADVTTVGTEDVRGVSTTHMRTVLTVDDILANAPEGQREQVEAALDGMDAASVGLDEFPVDVWVDGEGLVRRIRMEMEIPGQAAEEQPAAITTTSEFFDFGEPVEIVVPPADQVVDMSELSGGFGGTDGGD